MNVAKTPHQVSAGGDVLDYRFSSLGEEFPDDLRDVNMRNLVTCEQAGGTIFNHIEYSGDFQRIRHDFQPSTAWTFGDDEMRVEKTDKAAKREGERLTENRAARDPRPSAAASPGGTFVNASHCP